MTRDEALEAAGKILIESFPDFYGKVSFNLQGNRKSIHVGIQHEINVEIIENKQFKQADKR